MKRVLLCIFSCLSLLCADTETVSADLSENNGTLLHEGYYYKGHFKPLYRYADTNVTLHFKQEDNLSKRQKTIRYFDDVNRSYLLSDRVIVKFKNRRPDIGKIENDYNITLVKKLRRIYIFQVPRITDVLTVAKKLYENEPVSYVQPSFAKRVKNSAIVHRESVEKFHIRMQAKENNKTMEDIHSMTDEEGSVNYYKYYDDVFRYTDESFWQIHNRGGFEATAYSDGAFTPVTAVADVDPDTLETIDAGYTGKNVRVAVIDSSFELNHPDLRFSNSYNIFRKNKDITPDSTGDFHGTAVAGVIAANRDNNYGIMGIAPDAYLIGLNGLFQIEDSDYFSESYIEMFYTALDMHVDIINCSWETMDILDEAIEDVLQEVAEEGRDGKGTFIVFSTGNDGTMKLTNEAALPFVISVGSIESNGKRAGYSNYGKRLDLVAPSNFVSLDLLGDNGFDEKEMGFVTGTSFSAPVVSGCIALILEANPDLTRAQVLDIIYSATKKVGEGNYTDGSFSYEYTYNLDQDDPYSRKYSKNREVGYGLIDVYAAVQKAKSYVRKRETIEVASLPKKRIDALGKGWSILASAAPVTDMAIFDDVEIVWSNIDGAWLGYSPNPLYREELTQKGVLLDTIPASVPLWIYKE